MPTEITKPAGQPEAPANVPETVKPTGESVPESSNEKPVTEKKNSELTDREIRDLPKEELHKRLYGEKKEKQEDAPPAKKEEAQQKQPDAKKPEGSDEDDLDISDPEKAKAAYRELKKELATRTKQTKDQEAFVNKQGNEIGEMRKIIGAFNNMLADPGRAIDFLKTHLPGANAAPKQGADNAGAPSAEMGDFVQDLLEGKPEGFIKALQNPQIKDHLMMTFETELAKRQTQALEAENTARKEYEEREKNVKIMVPEYGDIENDIYEIMRVEDQQQEPFIEAFKQGRFKNVPDDIIYHYSKRALARREIKQLKERIAQLEGASANVLDQIDRAAKGGAMANTSGQGPSTATRRATDIGTLTQEQIRNMPDKELSDTLKKYKDRK